MTKDQLRAAEPKIAAWADDIRKELEGSEVSHLRVDAFAYVWKTPCERGITPTVDQYKK